MAHGLTDALRLADYDLLIAYTEYSVSEEERQLKNLLARRPEAIVLTGSIHSREAAKMLLASGIPVIEIMMATPLVRKYIMEGEFEKLKGTVGNRESGSYGDKSGPKFPEQT